jgi:5'-nucleotidase
VTRAITLIALVSVVGLAAAGCQRKANVPVNESVTDVGAPETNGGGGFQNQPQNVAPQPVVYDTVTTTPMPATPESGGTLAAGSYTVKKGDTLYSIARQRWGDGKQWVRITEANPGLAPEKLRAGQTINIP